MELASVDSVRLPGFDARIAETICRLPCAFRKIPLGRSYLTREGTRLALPSGSSGPGLRSPIAS
jgi:hypothetical protein